MCIKFESRKCLEGIIGKNVKIRVCFLISKVSSFPFFENGKEDCYSYYLLLLATKGSVMIVDERFQALCYVFCLLTNLKRYCRLQRCV
jgi:hypothetical protein